MLMDKPQILYIYDSEEEKQAFFIENCPAWRKFFDVDDIQNIKESGTTEDKNRYTIYSYPLYHLYLVNINECFPIKLQGLRVQRVFISEKALEKIHDYCIEGIIEPMFNIPQSPFTDPDRGLFIIPNEFYEEGNNDLIVLKTILARKYDYETYKKNKK